MKKTCLLGMMIAVLIVPATATASLEDFLSNLNIEARADMSGFSLRVSTQFGVPLPEVQAVLGRVSAPADAFMCFQLGQMAGKPVDRVVEVYRTSKGQGWGVIARSLGIKPGSPEFHALKRGDLSLTGEPQGSSSAAGKGKGKGKGHNK